ncbi:MAG: RnfABCDGE type electron transport complex subunit G [Bacteroidaceae bacterium]|nr:RnfABCDGE type electron transport complex subunit G [Bacteroidaceae bacterium]
MESNLVNMVMVLCVIAVAAALSLAIVNAITSTQIAKIEKDNLEKGIKEVLGANPEDSLDVEEIHDSTSTFVLYKTEIGIAVKTQSNGFGGPIEVLVGFAPDSTICGYKILKHSETPGLGAKAGEWFQRGNKGDIIGKNPANTSMTVSKDGGDIDAITASTITSRAFLKAVMSAFDRIYGSTHETSDASTQEKKGGKQ